jgi:methylated-DNA-[protein]-cysteine S-methyltransferase
MAWTTYTSPLGRLTLVGGATGLRYVYFPGGAPSLASSERDPSALTEPVSQPEQYFAGERQAFELELDLGGSSLQHRGWRALQEVPYGPIVVPCHRVIAADGSLTGYLGGLQRKQTLLDFEAAGGAAHVLRHRHPQQLALL